jgi:hypothetical protein
MQSRATWAAGQISTTALILEYCFILENHRLSAVCEKSPNLLLIHAMEDPMTKHLRHRPSDVSKHRCLRTAKSLLVAGASALRSGVCLTTQASKRTRTGHRPSQEQADQRRRARRGLLLKP